MKKSWLLFFLIILCSCTRQPLPSVVVYTSVDQLYSEPILKSFEEQSGIRVQTVYDIEAAKTTGLVSRLFTERQKPQADVFWSSEIAQTLWLKEQGILSPYHSASAADIPAQFKDTDGYWTGLGYRARVIIVNTDLVASDDYPRSLTDLLSPEWGNNEMGMANPLFGTTATHAAALYAAWGPQVAADFFRALQAQDIRIVDGNSVVRDMVANGDLKLGLTDTDDAYAAEQAGKPVAVIFPDQDGSGTLAIPNTVALISGGPNPVQGQALIDYLLSSDVESRLIQDDFLYGSVRTPGNTSLVMMSVSSEDIAKQIEPAKNELQEIFLR
jgi:iron(III) transport system substrate-binding protein